MLWAKVVKRVKYANEMIVIIKKSSIFAYK